ncbi:MAG: hypothetical protein FWC16_05270 [Defluviitaleaceae bacterium]|nr:hypothetical protein [Defluviitaleaceae bacterium]MCL2274318.1 hypothetical protein [Defluviitaleaceae bacterium]
MNIKRILQSNNGESLMESIISIMVFTVLVAAVTMILTVALRWTSQSFDEAFNRQYAANAAVGFTPDGGLPPYVGVTPTTNTPITFSINAYDSSGVPVPPITQNVTVNNVRVRSNYIISAFMPVVEEP